MKPISFRKFLYIPVLLFISLLLFQCEKDPFTGSLQPEPDTITHREDNVAGPVIDSIIMSHQDSAIVATLPGYFRFLDHFRKQGYVFYDFRTYIAHSSRILPPKLIVIRHDVHYRDLENAYMAFEIEKILIGPGHSTFFVMLNDPLELANTNFNGENDYLALIHHLDSCGVDVQPHISPIDMYIAVKHPGWVSCSTDSLNKAFAANYEWEYTRNGTILHVIGTDIFNVSDINSSIKQLLNDYNEKWNRETNLTVQGYASHGSSTKMNYILNNAYLLDQLDLIQTGLYRYDTYNTEIFNILTYLSDNSLPSWMSHPETVSPDRYQFLMHPYQWKFIYKSSGMPENGMTGFYPE